LVHAALDKVDEPTEDAIMVGDTREDVHAARRAGVDTVVVLTGRFAI
jgi:phosphoglycolate phosphatase-like HAD superfamily hydrolase